MLTRTQILGADDLKHEIVEVTDWGGEVKVRTMTGTERDRFESSLLSEKGGNVTKNMDNLRAKLVVQCVVGEDGKRLFTDKDIEALGKKSAKAIDKVFSVAQRLNGIGTDEVEELTKN